MLTVIPVNNEKTRFSFSLHKSSKDEIKCLCKFLIRLEKVGAKVIHRIGDDIYAYKITGFVTVEFPGDE